MRETFRKLIHELGFKSDTQFAKAIGVSQNRISTFFRSEVKFPRLDIIINTKRKFPQVNLNALFGYEGPLLFSEEDLEEMKKVGWERSFENNDEIINLLKSQNDHYLQELESYRKQVQQLHSIIEKLQSD